MSLPRVSIIVTAYLPESRPYLDLCMRSIAELDYPPEQLEVLIVSHGTYARDLASAYRAEAKACDMQRSDYFNSHALNAGAGLATGEYLFLLNDDVILTKGSLKALVRASQHLSDRALVMPIGNDTQCGRYLLATPGAAPGPYRYEQVAAQAEQLMRAESHYPMGLIFVDTLYMYAVLMHQKVFERIGQFDTSRKGHDDEDYSRRARALGAPMALTLDALVWHAGGVSADHTFSQRDREASLESFKDKWGAK